MIKPQVLSLIMTLFAVSPFMGYARAQSGTANAAYASRDTVIVDCELYLFGRFVEPVRRGDERGHIVRRTGSTITINDIVFFDVLASEEVPSLSQEFLQESNEILRTFQSAANQIRETVTLSSSGAVLVNGEVPEFGKILPFSAGERESNMTVEFTRSGFFLKYRGDKMFFWYRPPTPPKSVSPREQQQGNDRTLERAYDEIVSGLVPGAIVIMGSGYRDTYYNGNRHQALREALSLIPSRASELYPGATGEKQFERLSINGFNFAPAIVRDFVSAGGNK